MIKDQYLSKEELVKNIPDIKISPEDLGSTDTYHEDKILKRYLSYKVDDQILIYKAAVQLAIIGYGNKNYGFIRINDKEILSLFDLFQRLKIKFNEKINSKYDDDELSARRLLRLFRWQIKRFIETYDRPSYLWLKYANKNDNSKFMSICFPGGEHLVETKDEAIFLLDTYQRLDNLMKTKFVFRLKRVFIARGIFDPMFFNDKYID